MHVALKNRERPANTLVSLGGTQIWVAVGIVLVVVLGPSAVALAELTWTAPSSCPDARDFANRVKRLGGEHLLANTTANVRVDRASGGFRARMQLHTPEGNWARSLEDPQCERLADAVALVLALSETAAPARDSATPALTLSLGGGGILGPLPRLAPYAELVFGLQWSRIRIALQGGVTAPQSKRLEQDVLSGRFELWVAALQASFVCSLGRLELAPGVGLMGYRLTVTGLGGATSLTQHTLSWGPMLGMLARLPVAERWAVCLSLNGVLPLLRSRFVFSDAGTLHRPGPFALHAWLGVELRL